MAKPFRVFCVGCALTFALSMAGCSGSAPSAADEGAGTDAYRDASRDAVDSSDNAAGADFSQATRVVIRDASTGAQLAEVTDSAAMAQAFAPFSGEQGISFTPDAPEEYVFEVWQNGADGSDQAPLGASNADEFEAYEITTYEGSDTVRMKVVLMGISFSTTPESGADNLRHLL